MRSFVKLVATRARNSLVGPILESIKHLPCGTDAAAQIQLQLEYRRLVREGAPLPGLRDIGFKVHSQADEDGILLFLFSVVGFHSKTCVEICAGDGAECNTANLILNHGWHGLLVDGDIELVERGRRFYGRAKNTYVYPPRLACSWVTRRNVNDIIGANGFAGEIDLLSIDVDGVDWWIWDAIEIISPRVVVVEYQDILGPERTWTVPYSDDFCADRYPKTQGMPNFAGASLRAFVKLGRRKGYRLVGVNRYQYNAFFVRAEIGGSLIAEIEAKDCFSHPKVVWGMRERFPTVKDLPWIEV